MFAVAVLFTCDSVTAQDTTPPPAPVNLRILQLGPTANRVAIQWNAVTDTGGAGLKEYILYRNGLEITRNTSALGVDTYLLAGHQYNFRVAALDNSNNVSQLSTGLVVTALSAAPIAGTKSVKVLLLRFADWPDEPYTTNYANDVFFNNPFSVRKFFEEVSYGRVTISGDAEGWYTLPKYGSNYCDFTLNGGLWYGCGTTEMLNDALTVIPNSSRIATNDIVVLLIHGMGTVGLSGGKYKYIAATNGFTVDVVAHEIGHGFNATQHAGGWDSCTPYPVGPDIFSPVGLSGCTVGRYTDGYDTMAAGTSMHFNMHIKDKMGFLLPSNIQVATNDGDYALHMAEAPTNAVQMIKIPLPHEAFYFLEYRTPTGFNGPNTPKISKAPIDGVLIHLRPSRFPGSDADTLRPNIVINTNTPFIDPFRGIRVELKERRTNHVIVRILGLEQPFRITDARRMGLSSQDMQLTFNSIAGGKYAVQGSTNLQTWQTLKTNILASGLATTNVLTNVATNSAKFFRLGVDPIR
jgi:hypothetical protein